MNKQTELQQLKRLNHRFKTTNNPKEKIKLSSMILETQYQIENHRQLQKLSHKTTSKSNETSPDCLYKFLQDLEYDESS